MTPGSSAPWPGAWRTSCWSRETGRNWQNTGTSLRSKCGPSTSSGQVARLTMTIQDFSLCFWQLTEILKYLEIQMPDCFSNRLFNFSISSSNACWFQRAIYLFSVLCVCPQVSTATMSTGTGCCWSGSTVSSWLRGTQQKNSTRASSSQGAGKLQVHSTFFKNKYS